MSESHTEPTSPHHPEQKRPELLPKSRKWTSMCGNLCRLFIFVVLLILIFSLLSVLKGSVNSNNNSDGYSTTPLSSGVPTLSSPPQEGYSAGSKILQEGPTTTNANRDGLDEHQGTQKPTSLLGFIAREGSGSSSLWEKNRDLVSRFFSKSHRRQLSLSESSFAPSSTSSCLPKLSIQYNPSVESIMFLENVCFYPQGGLAGFISRSRNDDDEGGSRYGPISEVVRTVHQESSSSSYRHRSAYWEARDESSMAFGVHITPLPSTRVSEDHRSTIAFYENTTLIVNLKSDKHDVLCCNPSHLISKGLSTLSILRRLRSGAAARVPSSSSSSSSSSSLPDHRFPKNLFSDPEQVAIGMIHFLASPTWLAAQRAGEKGEGVPSPGSPLHLFFSGAGHVPILSISQQDRERVWTQLLNSNSKSRSKSLDVGGMRPSKPNVEEEKVQCVKHAVVGNDQSFGHGWVRRRHQKRVGLYYRRLLGEIHKDEFIVRKRVEPREIAPFGRGGAMTKNKKKAAIKIVVISRRDVGRRVLLFNDQLVMKAREHFESMMGGEHTARSSGKSDRQQHSSSQQSSLQNVIIDLVELKGMSISDQAKLFADADVVVGTHGAGLTWSFLVPPGGVLIELSGYHRFGWLDGVDANCGGVYGSHAATFGLHHIFYFSPAPTGKRSGSKHPLLGDRNRNIALSTRTFIELLEKAVCLIRSGWNAVGKAKQQQTDTGNDKSQPSSFGKSIMEVLDRSVTTNTNSSAITTTEPFETAELGYRTCASLDRSAAPCVMCKIPPEKLGKPYHFPSPNFTMCIAADHEDAYEYEDPELDDINAEWYRI